MGNQIYPAGTIRYVNYVGSDGKTYTKKQKYYHLVLSIPNDGSWSGFASIYKQKWITGSADNPPYNSYNKDLNKFTIISLPDDNIKLEKSGFLAFVNEREFVGDYYILQEEILINNTEFYNDSYPVEGVQDYIDSFLPGTEFNFITEFYYAVGLLKVYGWAEWEKPIDEQQKNAPAALDHDWTLYEALDKIEDLQNWADNNLLPPIFGPTNCVYFPSNLGDTKPDNPNDLNPIIKSYPIHGYISKAAGDNYNYYGYNYPVSSSFQQIKCKKDETFTINCNFPFIRTRERFDIIQDDYINEDNLTTIPSNKSYFTAQSYKVGQLIKVRFISGEDGTFNQYIMQAIIIKSDVPTEKFNFSDPTLKKYSVTFKFINDLNLTEDQYFNAKVVIVNNQETNYVQNETYSIQRYYKKDLGIGPRLGGSVLQASTNNTEGEFNGSTGLYKYSCVLKDEEKLNKPYLNISIAGDYRLTIEGQDISYYYLNHEFKSKDLLGQFEVISGIPYSGLVQFEDKKYIKDYPSYLIKNLDEHTYEYYQNLKKAAGIGGIYTFRESNENSDITFSKYD